MQLAHQINSLVLFSKSDRSHEKKWPRWLTESEKHCFWPQNSMQSSTTMDLSWRKHQLSLPGIEHQIPFSSKLRVYLQHSSKCYCIIELVLSCSSKTLFSWQKSGEKLTLTTQRMSCCVCIGVCMCAREYQLNDSTAKKCLVKTTQGVVNAVSVSKDIHVPLHEIQNYKQLPGVCLHTSIRAVMNLWRCSTLAGCLGVHYAQVLHNPRYCQTKMTIPTCIYNMHWRTLNG